MQICSYLQITYCHKSESSKRIFNSRPIRIYFLKHHQHELFSISSNSNTKRFFQDDKKMFMTILFGFTLTTFLQVLAEPPNVKTDEVFVHKNNLTFLQSFVLFFRLNFCRGLQETASQNLVQIAVMMKEKIAEAWVESVGHVSPFIMEVNLAIACVKEEDYSKKLKVETEGNTPSNNIFSNKKPVLLVLLRVSQIRGSQYVLHLRLLCNLLFHV